MSVPSFKPLGFFTPTQITGCQLWLDAADSSSITGTNVTQWRDKSGLNNNATPYSTSPQRSGNSILFSGANALKCGAFLTSTTCSVFIVNNFTSGFDRISFGCWKVQFGSFVIFQDGSIRVGVNNSATYNIDATTSTPSYTNTRIYGLTLSSSSTPGSSFTFNGSIDGSNVSISGTSSSGNATTCSQEVTIGGLMQGGVANYQLIGNVYEVIVFNVAVTSSQRQQIEGYLAQKWGLTGSLPPFHPGLKSKIFPSLPQNRIFNSPISSVFSPTSITGSSIWLDGNDPAGTGTLPTDGTSITTWVDKSSSGYNATVSGNPATLKRNIQNSKSIMRFNSSRYSVTYPSFPSTGYSFFIVMYLSTTSGGYQRIINGSFSDAYLFIGTNNASIATFNGNGTWNDIDANSPSVSNFQTWRIVAVTVGSSVLRPYVDGTAQNTKTGTTAPFSNFYIGDSGQIYIGDIGEIIVYNSVLTNTQRQQVEGYLAWKWGLQSNLPGDHPYKAAAPTASTAPMRPVINLPRFQYSSTGLVFTHQDGRSWKVSGTSIYLNTGTPMSISIYAGSNVYNSANGRVALFNNGSSANSVRHASYVMYTNSFAGNNYDFAWYFVSSGSGYLIYNDFPNIGAAWQVSYDTGQDRVLIVPPGNGNYGMVWNITPKLTLSYVYRSYPT